MQLGFSGDRKGSRPGFAGQASADNADNSAEPRINPRKVLAAGCRRVRQMRTVRTISGASRTAGCGGDCSGGAGQ